MQTVAEVTEEIIENSPYLADAIAGNLINLSALARHIRPDINKTLYKDIQEGAIVMALKRLAPKLKQNSQSASAMIKQIHDISVRTNLSEFTFRNSPTLALCEYKLFEVNTQNPQPITISQGVYETTIIAHASLATQVADIFAAEEKIYEAHNLSLITLMLPVQNVQIPGIYHLILQALAQKNINLIDTVSTSNEITLVFDASNIEKAFTTLNKLIRV